ncbi:cell division protein ZapA [Candidatus Sumerlaeota bacterium]|nr:cell division protein ZapA [Candidatus Sumerlaeota bacterium]
MNLDKKVEISILGHVFKLRCHDGEEEKLREAARVVEERIAELTETGGMVDSLRTALMAALYLAYELLTHEDKDFHLSAEYRRIQKRLRSLVEQIDTQFGNGEER